MIEKVFALQERLQDLGNPQVELHLLRSCLGVCKVNYLLHTIPPATIMSQLQLFDRYLRDALSRICNASISAHAWCQATLPLSLGGLGLREASYVSPAAFLGCCLSSQHLCTQLLSSFHGTAPSFLSIPGKESATVYLSSSSGGALPDVDHPSKAQHIFQHSIDVHQYSALLNSVTLRDQARIRSISLHSCASAWLRAIPSVF